MNFVAGVFHGLVGYEPYATGRKVPKSDRVVVRSAQSALTDNLVPTI